MPNALNCFFFNDAATTEIYTLSLHDALPICARLSGERPPVCRRRGGAENAGRALRHQALRAAGPERGQDHLPQIGRGHVLTPVTPISCMPSSAWKKK